VNSNEEREMLVVINGTIGVGKTWISKCLAREIPRAVCIEGDSLGFVSPTNDYVLNEAVNLISAYGKKGIKVFVFDLFFDSSQKLDWFISQVGIESHVFYLLANEDEISNRIRKRARPRGDSEILDSKRLRQNQDRMKNRGIEIDTNGKSAEQITSKIKELIFAD
jgi:deoxyadenosine/deoxycytidine kinase